MADRSPDQDKDLGRVLLDKIEAAHLGHADPRARRLLEALMDDAIGLVADGTSVVDLKLAAATLSEMREALGIFRPWNQGPRKVTVFGSARTPASDPVYRQAVAFGRRLAEAGFMVITGGGPGIMGAAVEGAGADASFGVGIRLPFEQQPHELLRENPKFLEFKYFFTRKLFFLKEASAIAVFPGGFGTHDEAFETLTLVQTGKGRLVPVVLVDVPGGDYWYEWERFVHDQLLAHGLISGEDRALYRITHDVDEAVAEISGFYRVFHSMRRIRKTTVIRLTREVDASVLDTLSDEFPDILDGRRIKRIDAMKEEADQPDLQHLPRLALPFNLHGFGRLRMLVNRLNDLGSGAAPG